MNFLLYDGSHILADSLGLKQHMNIRNTKKGEPIGGSLEFFSIMRDTTEKFPDHIPIVVWDGGISPKRTALCSEYRTYNKYYHISQALSPDSTDENRIQYLRQKDIITEILNIAGIANIGIDGIEHEDLIASLSTPNAPHRFVIVSDDDDAQYLMKPNCEIYRPFEDTYVQYESYLKNFGVSDIAELARDRAFGGDYLDWVKGCCNGVGEMYSKSLIKLLNHIGWDIGKAGDEKQMENICKELDIPFRKAYSNFDKDKYERNMKLYCIRQLPVMTDEENRLARDFLVEAAQRDKSADALELLYSAIDSTDYIDLDKVKEYHIKHRFSC